MQTRPKTLRQQLILFVLVPVALLLMGLGWAGFVYSRSILLRQWGEATTLKLQRAAHIVDMELNRPKNLLGLFLNTTISQKYGQRVLEDLIVNELKGLDGVLRVSITPSNQADPENSVRPSGPTGHQASRPGMMERMLSRSPSPHGRMAVQVTSPRFDASLGNKTVSLVLTLATADGRSPGQIELIFSFDHLVGLISEAEWWQHQEAMIVDHGGEVLASTTDSSNDGKPIITSLLPEALVRAMAQQSSGTIRTRNDTQDHICVFYRLSEAPWILVISAPAGEVLAPIHRFRLVYLALGTVIVISVLLLIRLTTARAVASIRKVSRAAEKIAVGDYDVYLPVRGSDEIGELMRRFNTMAHQLEEGAHMKQSLLLAQEVQQSLLPSGRLTTPRLEIAGTSCYCDETGGDYFDYIRLPHQGEGREPYAVVVGDVTGHGIAAALLMSTARALLHCRLDEPDDPARILTDVNRLLCADTADSGNFITLFFLCFEPDGRRFTWVRAGHDPGLLYDPRTDRFTELDGQGIALGVDETWKFTGNYYDQWAADQVLLIGTDGIWEAQNQFGQSFGKERVKTIVRLQAADSAQDILAAVIGAVTEFRGDCRQSDDITLVVIKRRGDAGE